MRVNHPRVFVAVMAMSALNICYVAITPLIADLARAFPEVPVSRVQLILTLPPLCSIPTILAGGYLAGRFSKKRLALTGLVLTAVGGLLPLVLSGRLAHYYFSALLLGLGIGFLSVMGSTLISEYYQGLEKSRVMGLQSVSVCLGAAVMSYLSGRIAEYNWRLPFSCYGLVLVVLAVVLWALPASGGEARRKRGGGGLPWNMWWLGALSFLYYILLTTFNTNISLLAEEMGYGAGDAGIATSCYTAFGILAGISLPRLIRIFDRNILVFACAVACLGFLLLWQAGGLALLYAGSALLGVSFFLRNPAGLTIASEIGGENAGMAIAVFSCCGQVGAFVSPLVMSLFTGSYQTLFGLCLGGMVAVGLLYGLVNPVKNSLREAR